ncbi:DNA topoisomerase 2, partial [Tanacetum coccineum]
ELRNNTVEDSRIPNHDTTTGKWTMVSFKPNLGCLEDDTFALMKRRVVDLAGCSSVKVELDTFALPNTFKEYVELYFEKSINTKRMIYQKVNDTWEICVAIADGHFDQVYSFVFSL